MWPTAAGPALLGLAASVVIIGLSTYPGLWFPARWFFSFPVLGSPRLPHWVAFSAYYGALLLLGLAWVWLLWAVRAIPRFPVWLVLAVFVLWAAPFVIGPSVSSEDVYAYVALGRLVERGQDPYVVGVNALGSDPVVGVTPPFWRDNPTPYGPVYVRVAWMAAIAGGKSITTTVVVLRLFGLACLLLLAIPVTSLARRAGARPACAVTAVLCSPLVLVELVGAAHNEPLMLLLLAGGVALGLAGLAEEPGRRRLAMYSAGVALCGAAAGVKLPGLLGVALLGWLWAGPGSSVRRRLPAVGASALLATTVLVVVSLGSGLGMGWVSALDVPQRAYTLLAPFTAFGVLVRRVLDALGWPSGWVLPVLRPAGSALGITAAALIITRAERVGASLALGLALLAVAATTPAVWPWYLLWGLVFVGTVTMPPVLQAAVVAVNLALTPLGPGSLDVTHRPTASALFMTLVVLGGGLAFLKSLHDRQRGRSSMIGAEPARAPGLS